MRYWIAVLAVGLAVLAPVLLWRSGSSPAAPPPDEPDVPAEALAALEQGRYWRASLILREYLATAPDTTPRVVILAAQAEAGWGEWSRVETLLAGRRWLDTLAGGHGWNLLGRSRLELGQWAASGQALDRFLQVAEGAGDRERGLAELRRALAVSRAGQPADAQRIFRHAAGLLPQIEDWIGIFEAEAAAGAGDTSAVRERLAATDPELARAWGWRLRVRASREAGDLAGALRWARLATNELATAADRAAAWQSVGELELRRGERGAARQAFRRALEVAPSSLAALDAARQLSDLPNATPDDRLRIARLYLRHGNLDRGITGLRAYLRAGYATGLEEDELELELGRALFRDARYADGERKLLYIADHTASARIAAEALLLAGRARYRQGRIDDGRATLLRAAERHPRERAAVEALFLLADLDHDEGELVRARRHYTRAVELQPDLAKAGLAVMRLAGMDFVERNYETAADVYERYRTDFPTGRRWEQATYWAAKAYLALGRDSLARARLREVWRRDPLSFYGLRAAELLGEDPAAVPLEPSPELPARVQAEVATGLARLDLLRELGQDQASAFEVERLKQHLARQDGALYALAEGLNARGYTLSGIRLGWEIHERERAWNARLLRIVYPLPYRNLIISEAEERGLNPFLVAGLIRQESMFNAGVTSPAGAIGLMQIMPATGRILARTAGMRRFDEQYLRRPEVNLHLGMRYFAELLQRYGDRLGPALAAYNAGPHRVARWRAFPEYEDEELFAERIPFEETRDYVKIVQQNARIYQALYGSPAPRRQAAGAPSAPNFSQ